MKKLTALLLAVMMACLMTAACAEDLLSGEWYLKTMTQGDQTMDVASMGLNVVLTLNADGTCTFVGMGSDSAGTWVDDADNNKITITIEGSPADAMLSDGELTVSEGEQSMIFTREAPAAEASETAEIKTDAAAEEFNGSWECIALEVGGIKLNAETAKAAGQELPKMTFQDGVIGMEGGSIAESFSSFNMPLTYADGTYSFALTSGSMSVSITANILQDGTMSLNFVAGEMGTTLYFAKAE